MERMVYELWSTSSIVMIAGGALFLLFAAQSARKNHTRYIRWGNVLILVGVALTWFSLSGISMIANIQYWILIIPSLILICVGGYVWYRGSSRSVNF
jgi:hypothetical protein